MVLTAFIKEHSKKFNRAPVLSPDLANGGAGERMELWSF